MIDTTAAVEAIDLHKTYPGDVEAVRGITFRVDPGEAFGLLGPNGAGKSTTIGMLNSSVTPSAGRALLGGLDVALDPLGTRAISSVVFQDAVVDGPLTGRQSLMLHVKLWGVPAEDGCRRIDELTDAAGIADLLDRSVATYSGGQRRRLEIVRALLSEPHVLFLDEPTVGLDTRIRHDLFDVLATLRERTGVTVILTTHHLEEAERLCDRIIIMDEGRIVAGGTLAELLQLVGMGEIIELNGPAEVLDDARLAAVPGISKVERGERSTRIFVETATGALPAIAALVGAAGQKLRGVQIYPVDLERVFMHLTGKQLRD